MQQILPFDPFPFLTPPRIYAIKSGVLSHTQDYRAILRDRLHLQQHMNGMHRSWSRRAWLIAHITEALTDDEQAEKACFGIMQGILFNLAHFCRFFKIYEAIDETHVGGPRIGCEPVTVRRARELPTPRLLFPPDAIEGGFIPPLSHLCVYDIGYFVRLGVVELYFLNQDGLTLHAMRQLAMLDDDYPQAGQESV